MRATRHHVARLLGGVAGALVGLYVWDRWLGPLPIPVAGALFLAIPTATVPGRPLPRWIAVAGVAGVLLGTAIHYYVHFSENRLQPEDGVSLWRHLLIDALQGLGVVLLLLLCCWKLPTAPASSTTPPQPAGGDATR